MGIFTSLIIISVSNFPILLVSFPLKVDNFALDGLLGFNPIFLNAFVDNTLVVAPLSISALISFPLICMMNFGVVIMLFPVLLINSTICIFLRFPFLKVPSLFRCTLYLYAFFFLFLFRFHFSILLTSSSDELWVSSGVIRSVVSTIEGFSFSASSPSRGAFRLLNLSYL